MWHGPDQQPYLEFVDHVSSQFLRRYVAHLLGSDAWDWRAAGPQHELVATLRDQIEAEQAARESGW
jgi:hypothetical protein